MRLNNISLLLAAAVASSASANLPSSALPSLAKRAFVTKSAAANAAAANAIAALASGGATAEEVAALVAPGGAGPESQPLSQASALDEADAPLIADIEMLSNMLAEVVKKENPVVYDFYTRFRKLGMTRAADPNDVDAFEEMKQLAHDITPIDTQGVMKTFSIALNLVNAAEVHHRMRLVRENEKDESLSQHVGPLPMVEDSIRGTMEILLEKDGVDPERIFERLITQKCEIVLTAHPTEVNRKTIIRKCECSISTWIGYVSLVHILCSNRLKLIFSHSM